MELAYLHLLGPVRFHWASKLFVPSAQKCQHACESHVPAACLFARPGAMKPE